MNTHCFGEDEILTLLEPALLEAEEKYGFQLSQQVRQVGDAVGVAFAAALEDTILDMTKEQIISAFLVGLEIGCNPISLFQPLHHIGGRLA